MAGWPTQAWFWLEWGSSIAGQSLLAARSRSPCRPFRLDLDPSLTAGCAVAKTVPLPILRTFAQPSLHRIAMNVAQLFHKLRIIANVEIVVPLLPEMLRIANQMPRYSLLQRLQRIGQRILFRFAEQQVNLLRHDYVPVNLQPQTSPHA